MNPWSSSGTNAGGDVVVRPIRSIEADEKQQEHDPANAQHAMDGARIAAAEGLDAALGGMEETVLVVFAAQQQRGQSRRERKRVEGRDGDGEGDGQRELR